MKARPQYQDLSREQLLDKAYQLGRDFEINSYSCSQCTVAAIHEMVGLTDDLVKASTSLCAGTAFQGLGTCGGLSGGIIALDYFFGRPWKNMSYTELKMEENIPPLFAAQAVARSLYDKYVDRYGTIMCAAIQQQLFGRYYYIEDQAEFQKFEQAGAHTDPKKCVDVVGTAARWTMEILIDKGAIEVAK
jgi:C_GCAxxG_C_C family probable redox protein